MFTSVKHNPLQNLFKVQALIVLNKRRFLHFNRFDLIIGTSSIVCGAGSVQLSGVRPSVRLFVCLSVCPIRPPHAAAASLLLWARQPVDIDRLLHGRWASGKQQAWRAAANARRATLLADVGR